MTDAKRGFVGADAIYRKHALAYPNHSFKMFGGQEALTQFLWNVVEKLALEGWNATSCKPIWGFHTQGKQSTFVLHVDHVCIYTYIYMCDVQVVSLQPDGCNLSVLLFHM